MVQIPSRNDARRTPRIFSMKHLSTTRNGTIAGALILAAVSALADEQEAKAQSHPTPTVSYHTHPQAGGGGTFEVTVTTRASTHGLDLSTPAGIAALQARIQPGAVDVCAEWKRRGAPDRREEAQGLDTVTRDAMARTAKRLAAVN
jgi:UrcA family protein